MAVRPLKHIVDLALTSFDVSVKLLETRGIFNEIVKHYRKCRNKVERTYNQTSQSLSNTRISPQRSVGFQQSYMTNDNSSKIGLSELLPVSKEGVNDDIV